MHYPVFWNETWTPIISRCCIADSNGVWK